MKKLIKTIFWFIFSVNLLNAEVFDVENDKCYAEKTDPVVQSFLEEDAWQDDWQNKEIKKTQGLAQSASNEANTKESKKLDYNTENWMECLNKIIGNTSLWEITMPGSHDSGTYCFTSKSPVSSAAKLSKFWRFFKKLSKSTIANYNKTQHLPIYQQLECGVRYLDFRVCLENIKDNNTKVTKEELYLCHELRGNTLEKEFSEISNFLSKNKKEIIILEITQLFKEESGRELLINLLIKYFGDKMADYNFVFNPERPITQNLMLEKGKQIIVFYQPNSPELKTTHNFLCSNENSSSFWPNENSVVKMMITLMNYHNKNSTLSETPKFLKVLQVVVTPSDKRILFHPYSSLRKLENSLFSLKKALKDFILNGKFRKNIVMTNFCEEEISKMIINKNFD